MRKIQSSCRGGFHPILPEQRLVSTSRRRETCLGRRLVSLYRPVIRQRLALTLEAASREDNETDDDKAEHDEL